MSIIDKPSDYFETKIYTGTGSELAITGVGFQPDWVWTKSRSNTLNHNVYDSVRGVNKGLKPNTNDAEFDDAQSLKSFNSDGFTVGTDSHINTSSATFASWNWKANGSGSLNEVGSIDSTVSANTTSGFSIVSWTGNATDNATVGHGLSQKPDMVIIKARENTSSWVAWHKDLTGDDYIMFLDATDAQSQYSTILKNQSASVLTLGTNSAANANTQGFISYNFHSVQGYSKFGSYTGNGSTDGTFVYTGFKPAFVIAKPTSSTGYWSITDNKRLGYNSENKRLYPNSSDDEESQAYNLLSNGFKVTNTSGTNNSSGVTYIYMAFASSPFTTSSGVPTTAR